METKMKYENKDKTRTEDKDKEESWKCEPTTKNKDWDKAKNPQRYKKNYLVFNNVLSHLTLFRRSVFLQNFFTGRLDSGKRMQREEKKKEEKKEGQE
jgi:hypothetical protein